MKIITTFCLYSFLFFSFQLKAQYKEFAPIGAEWHYSVTVDLDDGTEAEAVRFWVSRDTLVEGKTCRLIENDSERLRALPIAPYCSKAIVPSYIMYEENKKVYNWYKNQFYLIFDFGAEVGDTLTLHVQPAYIFYHSGIYYPELPDSMYSRTVIVRAIDSINVNGIYLKRIEHYIERIGCINDYIIKRHSPEATIEYYQKIRCYHDNEISYTRPDWTKACDWSLLDITPVSKKETQVYVYPNPAKEYIHIEFLNEMPLANISISIENSLGKIVLHQKITTSTTRLSIPTLPSGIYFVKIQQQHKTIQIHKIIVL